ncbi:MAG TPA: hypothetical protein VFG04_15455 [Planctomycetaceae bacterium]|jgi:hypothetical protein|nr:hypothetical protein [Planctomycetaceae bacterium]
MRLKTGSGDVHFNPHLISHVHLNSDRTLLTVHFINGTHSGFAAETEEDRGFTAAFLEQLTAEQSGFVAVGNEVLNLKSALWVAIPDEGPIQIRSGDSRTRSIDEQERERIAKLLAE